jgi:putative methylase
MKRKKLEILISGLSDVREPRPDLEQYRTPSAIVCDILFEALSRGDIDGKKVCELGCGAAPFAIGSWILGAEEVLGVDIDERSLITAKENLIHARSQLKEIPRAPFELMAHDLTLRIPLSPRFDTILMNPPFGAQKQHADRPFIERAMEISDCAYSIHNGNSYQFLKRLSEAIGVEMDILWEDSLEIPARFEFHTKEKKEIGIVVVRFFR